MALYSSPPWNKINRAKSLFFCKIECLVDTQRAKNVWLEFIGQSLLTIYYLMLVFWFRHLQSILRTQNTLFINCYVPCNVNTISRRKSKEFSLGSLLKLKAPPRHHTYTHSSPPYLVLCWFIYNGVSRIVSYTPIQNKNLFTNSIRIFNWASMTKVFSVVKISMG